MHFLSISIFFCFLVSFPFTASAKHLALNVKAEAAILMNADTGVILYEKNAHASYYPASITKVATALLALKKASDKMDQIIIADQESIGTVTEEALRRSNYTLPAYSLIPDGSDIGIKKGEELSLGDLMYGMMLASGNDAANLIAKFVGGSIPQFMDELNTHIKQLGCRSTVFYNPHGLHHPKQLTTAYEMALITQEALKDPLFREIISTVRYKRPKTNKQDAKMLIQTNRLLRKGTYFYPKAIGVKTGYYSLAGNTFVAAAKEGDRTLIAVLLKAEDRKDIFLGAKSMFEAAFSQPKMQRILLHKGPQKFELKLPGAKRKLTTYVSEDVVLEYYPAEEQEVTCLLYWDKQLQLPISKGQHVGELVLQLPNQQILQKVPLYAQDNVKTSWLNRLKALFSKKQGGYAIIKALAILALIMILGILLWRFFNQR